MTTSPRTASVVADPRAIEARLGLSPDTLDARYTPALHSLSDAQGREAAVLLETGRPGTLARKFSRVSGAGAAVRDLVEARTLACFDAGGASAKWEDPGSQHAEVARELGFAPLAAPAESGPGTSAPDAAWVRYAEPWPHAGTPYYRQTTDFSCGPVSLLMAEAHWLGAGSMTRDRERQIWRRATRFTGCGAWALALQVDHDEFALEAYDTEFLAPQVTPMEPRDARAFANEEDIRLVAEAGIAMNERLFDVTEIVDAVERGARVLVLIDERRFHGEEIPHWVVVHSHRDGVVLLNDPWVEGARGESWVDSLDIPVSVDELDQMAWWGDPRYRSILVLSKR